MTHIHIIAFIDLLRKIEEAAEEASNQTEDSEPRSRAENVRQRRRMSGGDASNNADKEEKENSPKDYTPEQLAAVKR